MSDRQNDLFLDISDIETDFAHMHAYIDRLETQMSIRRTPGTRARQNSISSSHSGASVNNSGGGDDNQAAGVCKRARVQYTQALQIRDHYVPMAALWVGTLEAIQRGAG